MYFKAYFASTWIYAFPIYKKKQYSKKHFIKGCNMCTPCDTQRKFSIVVYKSYSYIQTSKKKILNILIFCEKKTTHKVNLQIFQLQTKKSG